MARRAKSDTLLAPNLGKSARIASYSFPDSRRLIVLLLRFSACIVYSDYQVI
jgi:hypothetical protein